MNQTKTFILGMAFTLGMLTMAIAQPATLRGKVTNGTTGEVLIGATILLQDANFAMKGGAYSDIEGSYTIKAPAGSYKLILTYIGFLADTLDITAAAGEVIFNETLLLEEAAETDEVIIEAKRSQASDLAFQRQKQNSVNAIDGVTFDLVQRTGDANVAAAVTRVVGVTVEGGKYIYVRGLGDRYSKTMLNGAEIPGLDPNKNTVQMDIFPSNLIDNVTIYKNFTPDLPGSFTGGLIDVRTKDFPDRLTIRASASVGFNPVASLRDDFIADELQSGEGLANTNANRDLPSIISEDLGGTIPSFPQTTQQLLGRGQQIEDATKSFQTSLSPVIRNSGLNQNYNFSIGNQYLLGNRPFGFIASLSYRRNFQFYENAQRNVWFQASTTADELTFSQSLTGNRGEDEILWGGLIKLSYKPTNNNKISFNFLHNQSGNAFGELYEGAFTSSGGDLTLQSRTTGYTARQIDVFQLQGDHALGGKETPDKFRIDWIVSRSFASQYEPDLRFFANEIDGGEFAIENGNGYPNPLRFYRNMMENNLDARLNFTLEVAGINTTKKTEIQFGGAYTNKNRDFTESRFELAAGNEAEDYNGSIADYTADDNLFDVTIEGNTVVDFFRGNYYIDRTLSTNIYEAFSTVAAGYGMVTLPIGEKWKFIGGARYENTNQEIVPEDSTVLDDFLVGVDTVAFPDLTPGLLQLNDVLPAANFIYQIQDNMNLRFGYSRTLARPNVVEMSPFLRQIDPVSPIIVGNPFLERTLIDNFDARWEWFFGLNELVSVSAFYKNFQDPIGLFQDFSTQNIRFRYDNLESALVYGTEIELKKNFGFISEGLQKLQFSFNASFIYSESPIDSAELAIISQFDPERTTRRLFGQSPYVFNGELAYIDKEELGLQASLSLNIFGPKLYAVGGVGPDIFEQPRPSLNFSLAKTIKNVVTVRFRANNILNPLYSFRQTYNGEEYIWDEYRRGSNFSLGASFRLN
ncbi:MAG: TonB-dependent receptor [Bacteroidia bacterium]|nr:TonB-dependent receptor [Bacteroidia bacterium]